MRASQKLLYVIKAPSYVRRRNLFTVSCLEGRKKVFCPVAYLPLDWVTAGHSVTFVNVTHSVFCSNVQFVASKYFHVHHISYLLLLVDCAYVITYTSSLSHQTTAVKSSLFLDKISPCFSHLFGGSKASGIPCLSDHSFLQQLIFCCNSTEYTMRGKLPMFYSICQVLYYSMCCCRTCSCFCPVLPLIDFHVACVASL